MNKKILVNTGFITATLVALALSANVEAAKLYKWVDADGRISYQDKPPPSNSKILSEETLKERKKVPVKSEEKLISSTNSSPVDVYINKNCSVCDQVIDLLKTWDVAHNVKMINDHREIQRALIEQTTTVAVPAVFYQGKLFSDIDTIQGLKQNLINTGHLLAEPKPEVKPKPAASKPDNRSFVPDVPFELKEETEESG